MGHGDREIAYMLGLSRSSIGKALGRARRKLQVNTRVEMIAVWRAGETQPAPEGGAEQAAPVDGVSDERDG
jgi:hypothetical protein